MWQLDTDLLRNLPYWFRRILDFQEICKTESAQMEALAAAINAVADNFFFQTMDEGAVSTWEKIFGIVPNPQTETLDFRRQRVLNRVSMQPPFTLGFLYQKLDQIIGKGKYEIHVDYPNYTLYILSSAENQSYATEVSYTVGRIKPAHIVFINQPFVGSQIALGETVALSAVVWQYRLGSWGLGLTPFVLTEDKEVVVVPSNYSVQQELLEDTAKAIPPNVASARINGSIVISSLDRTTVGNVAQVQYTVTAEQTTLVTQIELLDSDGNVLTTSPVYVPVTEPAIFTHKIQVDVKEG